MKIKKIIKSEFFYFFWCCFAFVLCMWARVFVCVCACKHSLTYIKKKTKKTINHKTKVDKQNVWRCAHVFPGSKRERWKDQELKVVLATLGIHNKLMLPENCMLHESSTTKTTTNKLFWFLYMKSSSLAFSSLSRLQECDSQPWYQFPQTQLHSLCRMSLLYKSYSEKPNRPWHWWVTCLGIQGNSAPMQSSDTERTQSLIRAQRNAPTPDQ